MNILQFQQLFNSKKPLIGVVHLPALPGYSDSPGLQKIVKKALTDIEALEHAGFQAALIENDGDHPPHVGYDKKIWAQFQKIMKEVTVKTSMPLGIEILYDMPGTVQLAASIPTLFARLDVFVDSGITKYGDMITAEPTKIIQLKQQYKSDLLLFTDVHVKHLTMVEKQKSVEDSAKQAVKFGSDGIIITGNWTGKEPSIEDCTVAKKATPHIPIIIGSGFSKQNCMKLLSVADGAIVATSIKSGEYIDTKKAQELASIMKGGI
jgi:uncharacterized protein